MTRLSIGRAWDETRAVLRGQRRLITPIALAFFLFPSAVMTAVVPGDRSGLWLLLAVMIAALGGQGVIALLAIGWQGSAGGAIKRTLAALPSALGALAVFLVPLTVISTVAVGVVLATSGIDPSRINPAQLAELAAMRWVVLLLMLGLLFLGTRLYPLMPVAAAERLGPIALARRCFSLTRGNFWRLLGVLLALSILGFVAGRAVHWVVGSLALVAFGPIAPFSLSAVLIGLASGLASALVGALGAAFAGRVYAQLASNGGLPDVSRAS